MNTQSQAAIARLIHSKAEELHARAYSAAITSQTADDVQVTLYNNGMAIWRRWSFEDDFFTDLNFRLKGMTQLPEQDKPAIAKAADGMRNKVVMAQADYAGLMQDNEQYIDNILSVARSIRKPCYAMRLIQYIDNSFPANIHTMYRLQFSLLKTYCDLNRSIICTEDGIQPAIAVVNMITVESIDHETVAHLNCMIAAQYDIIQTGAYMDSKCSYEDFCDKYSHILNR